MKKKTKVLKGWDLVLTSLRSSFQKDHPLEKWDFERDLAPAIKIAKIHRVFPHFYRWIMAENFNLSLNQKKLLENAILIHQKESLVKLAFCDRILNALDEIKIDYLILKGPTLAKELYGDPSMRMFSDLDIFISKENLTNACAQMEKLNFYPLQKTSKINSIQKDVVFDHPKKILRVEIHFKLMNQPFLYQMNWKDAWNNRKTTHFRNRTTAVMSDEMNFIYLCGHGHKHAWERLDWLFDFAIFYQNILKTETHRILTAAKTYRIEAEIKSALLVAESLLGMPIGNRQNFSIQSQRSLHKMRSQLDLIHQNRILGKKIGRLRLSYWRLGPLTRQLQIFNYRGHQKYEAFFSKAEEVFSIFFRKKKRVNR